MSAEDKIRVGVSVGDLHGVGLEVIQKTFSDSRMLQDLYNWTLLGGGRWPPPKGRVRGGLEVSRASFERVWGSWRGSEGGGGSVYQGGVDY